MSAAGYHHGSCQYCGGRYGLLSTLERREGGVHEFCRSRWGKYERTSVSAKPSSRGRTSAVGS